MAQGKLESIWIKRMRGGPMDAVAQAELVAGKGVRDSADQGRKRQVTLLEKEVWDALMAQLGGDLDPKIRRANLLVSGVQLADTHGQTLCIGGCEIRIYGETKPCERMDAALPGLKEAMFADWKGGAFGEVIVGGSIATGDGVRWKEDLPS